MKNLFISKIKPLGLLAALTFATLCSTSLNAAECGSEDEDVVLESQADVNNFQANYGGGGTCDTINYRYLGIKGPNIVDLSPLSAITRVKGNLQFFENSALQNVDGLSSLRTVDGFVDVSFNSSLTNIDGLSGLTNVGGTLGIQVNPLLTDVDGLSALTRVGERLLVNVNVKLTNLDGLSALTSVGTNVVLRGNASLAACSGLATLLDNVDDSSPGPGPGAAGIPDVGDDVDIVSNLPGCNSVQEILESTPGQPNPVVELINEFNNCSAAIGCSLIITAEFPPLEIANAAEGMCSAEEAWREGAYVESIAKVTLVVADTLIPAGVSLGAATSCIELLIDEYYDDVVASGKNWIEEKEKMIQQLMVYRPGLPNLPSIWNIFVLSPVSLTVSDGLGHTIYISGDGQSITIDEEFYAIAVPYGDHKKIIMFLAEDGKEYDLQVEGDGAIPGDQYVLDLVKLGNTENSLITFDPTPTEQGAKGFIDLSVPVNSIEIDIDMNSDGDYESSQSPSEVLSVPTNHEINVGHSGAWYNPENSGQGQLIDVEPESQFMFLSWFTFTDADADQPFEQHWYTAQGNYTGKKAELAVYETLGGKFDDSQAVNIEAVGTATVSFADCGLGWMNYTIDTLALSGSFPLQRAIAGSDNLCQQRQAMSTQSVNINGGMDGVWFDQNTPGQGFLIDAHPNPDGDNFIFVAWFTYGDDTVSGQRWLTAQGNFSGPTAAIDVYETTGGSFDDSQAVNIDKIGTMNIDFQDCSNALLSYDLPDEALQNSIAISRGIPGAQALCEELNTAQ